MIRELRRNDKDLMLEWLMNEKIRENFRFNYSKISMSSVEDFIRNSISEENKHYAIVNENDEYMGTVSLKKINFVPDTAEIAIVLRENAMGKGYGKTAIQDVLKIAFNELNLNKVYLNVFRNNKRAIKLYEKIGFNLENNFQDFQVSEDIGLDIVYYSITAAKYNIKSYEILNFDQKGDDRGHLVIIEGGIDIPFEIKRTFYIFGSSNDTVRGCHANRKSEFVLINLSGSSKVKIDNGKNIEIINLDRPHKGVYIPKMIWKEMYDFSSDSVLLVLSSNHYDPKEYVRNYGEYIHEVSMESTNE